jgi:hypothetical protein
MLCFNSKSERIKLQDDMAISQFIFSCILESTDTPIQGTKKVVKLLNSLHMLRVSLDECLINSD